VELLGKAGEGNGGRKTKSYIVEMLGTAGDSGGGAWAKVRKVANIFWGRLGIAVGNWGARMRRSYTVDMLGRLKMAVGVLRY
jgi:hypothetical protein